VIAQAGAHNLKVETVLARARDRHGGGLDHVVGARRGRLDERRNLQAGRLHVDQVGFDLAVAQRPEHRFV